MNARGLSIPKLFNDTPNAEEANVENDIYLTPISVKALLEKLWRFRTECERSGYNAPV